MNKKTFILMLVFSSILKLEAQLFGVSERLAFIDSSVLLLQIKTAGDEQKLKHFFTQKDLQTVSACSRIFPDHKNHNLSRLYRVKALNAAQARWINQKLAETGFVVYIEYAPVYRTFLTPNDLHVNQWHLKKINAEQAWDIRTGNAAIKIAIVDDAVDINHEDLKNVVYRNTAEIAGNGIDDDGNGYVDDVNGWQAFYGTGNPNPPVQNRKSFTHGTHCAGIAAAETNNNTGIASIGYGIKLIPVACADSSQPGRIAGGYEGIVYAVDAGADVISLSWGGSGFSQTGQIVIDYATGKDIVVCAASGNDNTNVRMYPAAYNGVIAVAATDVNDRKATFSNYGAWIDVSAPGVNIWSSVTGFTFKYDYLSGTSMACPLTAGLCALMLSQNDKLTPTEVENCLKSGADNIQSLNPGYNNELGSGRINALKSLQCVKPLYTYFESNKTIVCPNELVQFSDLSSPNATSYLWKAPGAVISSSILKNPQFQFSTSGFYNIKLIVSDGSNFDSLEIMKYIEVRPASAKMTGAAQTIRKGESAFLAVLLTGIGPWNIDITDGVNVKRYNNISSNPFYFDVNPASSSKYYISKVSDSRCSGFFGDTAYVAVDTVSLPLNSNSCGNFDLITKDIDFGSRELPHSIFRLRDGNFAIVGLSNKGLIGGEDIFLSKFNKNGHLIWTKYFGTSNNEIGYPIGVVDDYNFNIYIYGGVFLSGQSTSYLCKIDSSGNVKYSRVSTNNPVQDQIRSAKLLSNNKLVFVGTSAITNDQAGSIYVADSLGSVSWDASFNSGGQTEHFIDVEELNNKIYAVGHTSFGSGSYGSFLVKFDLAGNTIWQKHIDYANYDAAMYMQKTHQNTIMSAHWVSYNGSSAFGSEDFGIFHCDTNGNRIWSKIFGKSGKDEISGFQKLNNYYYVSGITTSFDGGNSKLFVVKLDINGNIQWSKIYGASGEKLIKPLFSKLLIDGIDGSILLVGQKFNTTDDIVLYKIDECGNSNCPSADVVFNVVSENTSITTSTLNDLGLLNTSSINSSTNTANSSINIKDKCPPEIKKSICNLKSDFNFTYNCLNDSVRFTDFSIDEKGGKIKQNKWIFHDSSFIVGKKNVAFKYNTTGNYKVTLITFSDTPTNCSDTFIRMVQIGNKLSSSINFSSNSICLFDSVKLAVSSICGKPPFKVQWFPSAYFQNANVLNPVMTMPASAWVYYVLTDSLNLISSDSVYINVNQNCCSYQASIKSSSVAICLGETIDINNVNQYTGTGSQNKWYVFKDGALFDSLITLDIKSYKPLSIGRFTFRLKITGTCKTSQTETDVFVYPLPQAVLGGDTIICRPASIQLGSNPVAQRQYSWSPSTGLNQNDVANPIATITKTIIYYLKVKELQTGCENTDSMVVEMADTIIDLGYDTALCEGSTMRLNVGILSNNVQFVWNDGSSGPMKTISKPGKYYVSKTNICGTFSDTIDISSKVCFCDLFIPNAFSPDGNAINDYFPEHHLDTIISLQIFNRWGEKLFDQESTNIGWDGTYKGSIVQQDVYLYLIEYRTCKGRYEYLHGTFTLLR